MFTSAHKKNIRSSLFIFSAVLFLLLLPVSQLFAFDPLAMIANQMGLWIYGLATFLGGMVLAIGGLLFDISINHLVIGMGDRLLGSDGGASGIGTLVNDFWSIVRDVLNMLFIFGFIYIGIKTILNSEDSGTRKALGRLIIAALLINFSLYITQVVVDVSNILSLQVYNQILDGGVAASGSLGTYEEGNFLKAGTNTISGAFLENTKINSWFVDEGIEAVGSFGNIVVFAICMMFFLIITGIIFAYGAILIVSRFVILIICMIFSPVLFLEWILPKFEKISKIWKDHFFKNAFFAPVFLFLIYISYATMQTLIQNVGEGATFASVLNGQEGQSMQIDSFIIILYFIIMIGFLYASIKVAQMMSIKGGSMMTNSLEGMGKGLRGSFQGLAYRNTVGLGLDQVRKGYEGLDKTVANNKDAPRFSLGGAKRLSAKAARSIAGGEAGRRATVKARDYGAGGVGWAEDEKLNSERDVRTQRNIQLDNLRTEIDKGNSLSHGDTERISMEKVVRDATGEQVVEMMKDDKDRTIITKVAGDLSEGQVKAIMDNKELDDGVKTSFAKARGEQVEKRLQQTNKKEGADQPPELAEVIGKAEASELKALGFQKTLDNADMLSDKQISDWKDLTPTEKSQIKAQRKKKIMDTFNANPEAGAKTIFGRFTNDAERAKLPKELFTEKESVQYLNTKVLDKIIENDGISEDERKKIKENVLAHADDKEKYNNWFRTPRGQIF